MSLSVYKSALWCAAPVLRGLLAVRQWRGKEDPLRLYERCGQPSLARPDGPLVWIHAASVGEAQSALILIEKLGTGVHILMTSGTLTSAKFLSARLPAHAMHQYVPLDAPQWVAHFLDHWRPDLALWMESELWPNLLGALKARSIPAVLVNARLSQRSYARWLSFPRMARELLSCFTLILTQTHDAQAKYQSLGAARVVFTDNIKFSAAPLPVAADDLAALQEALGTRPSWVYASTHNGEEQLAARLHARLKKRFADLLTIIVPRHPERRAQIKTTLAKERVDFRGHEKHLPAQDTGIYVADTLGELGLFYRLSPIAVIGRSFSFDGGGGHNPIEAAQMDCAVLSGPHVQYQQALFDEMTQDQAAILASDEDDLYHHLEKLLGDAAYLAACQEKADAFARRKSATIDTVMSHLSPIITTALEKY